MPTSVLFIGAHCGDALHLTPGEKGHPKLTPEEFGALKREEAAAAAEVLGLSHMSVLGRRDAEILAHDESLVDEIAAFIRVAKPDVILTHWATSIHPDHEACHILAQRAAFKAGIKWLNPETEAHWAPRTLFAENWEDRFGFVPQTHLDVAEDWETWRNAAQCYSLFRGEVVPFPYVEYYDHLSRVRGIEAGVERAIAFSMLPQANRRTVKEL